MKCEELLQMLNDYVDGEIDPSLCEEFRDEVEACNPCRVVIDTIRKTVTLYREEAGEVELPIAFHDKLHAVLRERWRRDHPDAPDTADPPDGPDPDATPDP
jgi:uncharacterized protein (DUF2267 family)